MKFSRLSSNLMRFLKCIIVFLIFVLIVAIPWFKLLAASDPSEPTFGFNETVNNLLTMAGGGGMGVLGSKALIYREKGSFPQQDNAESSGFLITLPGLHQQVIQQQREHLREIKAIREELKKIKNRINNFNDFLDRKYEDYKSKDTLY